MIADVVIPDFWAGVACGFGLALVLAAVGFYLLSRTAGRSS